MFDNRLRSLIVHRGMSSIQIIVGLGTVITARNLAGQPTQPLSPFCCFLLYLSQIPLLSLILRKRRTHLPVRLSSLHIVNEPIDALWHCVRAKMLG